MDEAIESIAVDVDDLIEKLKLLKEDNYASVKLSILSDGYCSELGVDAVGISEDDVVSYGNIDEVPLDF